MISLTLAQAFGKIVAGEPPESALSDFVDAFFRGESDVARLELIADAPQPTGKRRLAPPGSHPVRTVLSSLSIAWQEPKTAIGSIVRVINTAPQNGFIWYRGGSHHDDYANPGPGGAEMMHLVSGGLYVNGALVSTSDPSRLATTTTFRRGRRPPEDVFGVIRRFFTAC